LPAVPAVAGSWPSYALPTRRWRRWRRQALRGRLRRETTRTVLTGAFAALPVLTLRSLLPELAGLRRGDFPLWFRLLRALGNGLVLSSLTGLCLELLRDVRTLVEYAWLSGEPVERGDEE